LLDTPGHWPGHMAALVCSPLRARDLDSKRVSQARTTPDTFLFLAGDLCHFAGDFRPSDEVPFPESIPDVAFGTDLAAEAKKREKYPSPCPCSFFSDHHPQNYDKEGEVSSNSTPFYKLSTHKHSSYKDPPLATDTTEKMRKYFDADPNVLVCLAHDTALLDHLPVFNYRPQKDLNDWKAAGMKERCHWGWLKELPRYADDGSCIGPGMREQPLVDGLWKDGVQVESLIE
jgi:hypothetical protein